MTRNLPWTVQMWILEGKGAAQLPQQWPSHRASSPYKRPAGVPACAGMPKRETANLRGGRTRHLTV
jgi:hypothetical protein